MPITGLIATALAAALAFAVSAWVLRVAHRIGTIAEVNARSSHVRPTPSGGGLGIVAGGTLGAGLAVWTAPWPVAFVALLALAMALVGFLDDRRGLPVTVRLPVQLILAGAMLATLPLDALGTAIGLLWPVPLLALPLLLAAVYWINIFNFMDGIDGIAASEAIFILLAAAGLALVGGAEMASPLLWWFIAIAAAAAGFLALNWPPARIFMGDAGSTYLGFMLAYAGFATIAAGWLSLWQCLILVALFLADSTLTLLRRLARRERIFDAHRLHAYQHLSRRWGGHRPVTLLAIAVNIVWLLPCAYAAGAFPAYGPWLTALAYLPLVAALLLAGAGAPERRPA